MSNCFCHFCGYEVKDAAARAAIETLETNVNNALQHTQQSVESDLQTQQDNVNNAIQDMWTNVETAIRTQQDALQTQQDNVNNALQHTQQSVESDLQTQQDNVDASLQELESSLEPQDLTAATALTWINNGEGANVSLRTKVNHVRYFPKSKIVFFSFNIYFTGSMAAEEELFFNVVGAPTRYRDGSRTGIPIWHFKPATKDLQVGSCLYDTSGSETYVTAINIRALAAMDTEDVECGITCAGYYNVEE